MDNRTEQLADGVWRIDLAFWVSAYVLANDGHGDGGGLTLVDTGTRGMGPRLVRSIRMLGMDPGQVSDVLLTHWHLDHAGAASRFAESSAGPALWAGEQDLPVIAGRLGPADACPDAGAFARFLHRRVYKAPAAVAEVRPLPDGHVHPTAGGAVAVATPGHTPGHRALHLPARGVLIAGDAVMNLGRLVVSPRLLSGDRGRVDDSLARLATLDFDVLAPMHGPPIDRDARARLHRLLP